MRALACALALLAASSARAQDATPPDPGVAAAPVDPTIAEAQALFRRAVELGEQDRWAEALELFRRSWDLAPRPNTMFNVGFASFRLGRFRDAIPALDEYLARTEGETSERRDEAVRLRGEAVASLAEVRVTLDPPEARLLVDGDSHDGTGAERVVVLDPGRHVLRATAPGREEATLSLAVLAGERGERRIVLPVPAPIEEPPPPPGGTTVLEEPIFWILAGVLVVGAGVGIGVGVAVADGGDYGGSTGVVIEALRF